MQLLGKAYGERLYYGVYIASLLTGCITASVLFKTEKG
jgi:hypothetical protein